MKKLLLTLFTAIPFFSIAQTGISSLLGNAPKAALERVQQTQTVPQSTVVTTGKMNNRLNQQSLRFTENKGQVADMDDKPRPDVLFTAHSRGVKLFITATGIYYQFSRTFEKKKNASEKEIIPSKFDTPEIDSTQFYRLDMQLIGANKHPQIIKEGEGIDYENYYLAHCPNGILGVKNYNRITVKDIYPGIDWLFYPAPANNEAMEYDFVLHPGADISKIKLSYEQAAEIKLEESGKLSIITKLGTVTEHKPLSYQQKGAELESRFVVRGNTIGFEVKGYDAGQPLTIDPTLEWGSYYGGGTDDYLEGCAVDKAGDVYFAGYTNSSSDIASGGFQNSYAGNKDGFLAKFNAAGNRIWATYYGGDNIDYLNDCTTDKFNNVYASGKTASVAGIAYNGFQNAQNGNYDAMLVKFNAAGARIWATYYGGTDAEISTGCATDNKNNVYLTGSTFSKTAIATPDGFDTSFAGAIIYLNDAFLVKFDSAGNRIWGTYYGDTGADQGNDCATDAEGNVYMAGGTSSATGIAFNGYSNSIAGAADAFLVKFNKDGERLWGTYYGGIDTDGGKSCTADVSGNIYLAGGTRSADGISFNGFQNVLGGPSDMYVVKFKATGERLWATYYGGTNAENIYGSFTDKFGNIFLNGYAESSGLAYEGIKNNVEDRDAFLVKFSATGERLWATYYGGLREDIFYGSGIDPQGNIYLCGLTTSFSGIAYNAYDSEWDGGPLDETDGFIVRISDCVLTKPVITADGSVTDVCPGRTLILRSSVATSYLWSTGATTRSIRVATAGNYSVKITNATGCTNTSDTTKVTYQLCLKPTGLATGNITATSAKLSWAAAACAVGYRYEWRKKGTIAWSGADATAINKIITGLSPATTYQWRVLTACKVQPDTITSAGYTHGPEFTTLPGIITGETNNNAIAKNNLEARLYPNPVKDMASITVSRATGKLQITLLDVAGKQLWQSGKTSSASITLPTQNLAPGTYLVQVNDDKEAVVLRMVKE